MNYNEILTCLLAGHGVYCSTNLLTGESCIIEQSPVGVHENCFVEYYPPYPQLVLLGGGHVSCALCKACADLGFKITVVDDREQYACKENFPLADKIIISDFESFLASHCGGEGVYYAVLTRGHFQDRLCLEHILKKKAAYIGMIGSKRKNTMVFSQLLESGFRNEDISRVYAPIGIDINSDTPAEIAISIAAQLIKVRAKQHMGVAFDEKVLHLLCKGEGAVTATICEKSGSAPRGKGAKMVLLKNGDIAGTIGGGAAEGQVIQLMQTHSSCAPLLTTIQMTNESAKTEGLICGGSITILISRT